MTLHSDIQNTRGSQNPEKPAVHGERLADLQEYAMEKDVRNDGLVIDEFATVNCRADSHGYIGRCYFIYETYLSHRAAMVHDRAAS